MGHTVLVADDSLTLQRMAADILASAGLEVVTVSNGVTAIRKLATAKPHVIVADVSMPGKDGYELCDFVKKSPELAHVAVLLAVSDLEPYDEGRGAQVRADGIIRKPFDAAELLAAVQKSMPAPAGPAADAEAAAKQEGPNATLDAEAADHELRADRGSTGMAEVTLEEGLAFGDLLEAVSPVEASGPASAATTQPPAFEASGGSAESSATTGPVTPQPVAESPGPPSPAVGRIISDEEYLAQPWIPPAATADTAGPTTPDEKQVLEALLPDRSERDGQGVESAPEAAVSTERVADDAELAWYAEAPASEDLSATTDEAPAAPPGPAAATEAANLDASPVTGAAPTHPAPALGSQETAPPAKVVDEEFAPTSMTESPGRLDSASVEQIVEKVVRRMAPSVLSPAILRDLTQTLTSEIIRELDAAR
jgi:CheY-like chemotaxis protein